MSVFCNGTAALLIALHALRGNGTQVITTPFTFPATIHALDWNGLEPVFCDIEERTFNLDPERIEQLINADTKAILPVHVYGTPCDVDAIQAIADRHALPVIYDAAHALGVRWKGRALAACGDMSMLSFHATKLCTTFEGGALVLGSDAQKTDVDFLKNFGIADEETVVGPGINGKMNELQAAYGLLQLDTVDQEIARRRDLAEIYRRELRNVPGIRSLDDHPATEHNYAFFPILVDADTYGQTRNDLHDQLKRCNIMTRKYFYPLCSRYPCYSALPSAAPENLPVAERIASQVLCLPIYGTMGDEVARVIARVIREMKNLTPSPCSGLA